MSASPRRIVGVAAALLLAATATQAQGKGHDKEHGKGKDKEAKELRTEGRDDRDRQDDVHDGRRRDGNTVIWRDGRGRRDGHDEQGNRDDYDNRDGRRIPPGLARKPGGMPPGQYKKRYETSQGGRYQTSQGASVLRDILVSRGYTVVRSDNAGQSQYVYYRLRDGSVQRAMVSPGADRLGFTNVPADLLREVLARLY